MPTASPIHSLVLRVESHDVVQRTPNEEHEAQGQRLRYQLQQRQLTLRLKLVQALRSTSPRAFVLEKTHPS